MFFQKITFAILAVISGLFICLCLYVENISFKQEKPYILAEGTSGVIMSLGGLTHGGRLISGNDTCDYDANPRIIINNITTSGFTYVKELTHRDTTFHWKVVAQRKLYAWGWRMTYEIEVGFPFDGLPISIWGDPMAIATFKDGKLQKYDDI